uniref:Frizzled domain-containing protein n=1 Tax=Steinernema glaseri TaxID=37863 RepID=A0A1I7YXY6_9BILA
MCVLFTFKCPFLVLSDAYNVFSKASCLPLCYVNPDRNSAHVLPSEQQRIAKRLKEKMSPTMRRSVPSLAQGRHLNSSDSVKAMDIYDELPRKESRQSRNSVSSTGSTSTVDSAQINLYLQKRDSRSSMTGSLAGRRTSVDSTELFRKRSTSLCILLVEIVAITFGIGVNMFFALRPQNDTSFDIKIARYYSMVTVSFALSL